MTIHNIKKKKINYIFSKNNYTVISYYRILQYLLLNNRENCFYNFIKGKKYLVSIICGIILSTKKKLNSVKRYLCQTNLSVYRLSFADDKMY